MAPGERLAAAGGLLGLPAELLLHIWRLLADHASLAHCEQVCTGFRQLVAGAAGEPLWQALVHSLWETRQRPLLPLPPEVAPTSWKQKFVFIMRDSRRRVLAEEELIRAQWRFRFRQDLEQLHMTEDELTEFRARKPAELSFNSNGYYSSTIPGAPSSSQPLRWRLVETDDGSMVQISAYPLLQVERTPDWGWRMHNKFVEFYTVSKCK